MKKNRAVFLDRDGTLNEEVGYLDRIELLKIYAHAAEAIRIINKSGMMAIVITNQSGVARGMFTEEFITSVHNKMREMLAEQRAVLDGFYYCPHHPTEGMEPYRKVCNCRKPEPGLLLRAACEMNIDLGLSYMVGDTLKDVEAAQKVGSKGVLVRTGYGEQQIPGVVKPSFVAEDILSAVKWIMKDCGR